MNLNRSSLAYILIFSLQAVMFQNCNQVNHIAVYPAVPGLESSDLYNVTVNGSKIWTEKFRTNMDIEKLPAWFTSFPYTKVQQEVHIANLSGEGNMKVHIEVSRPVSDVSIRPVSRGIHAVINGNSIEFEVNGPDKLYINADSLPPLCLFINPPEKDIPGKNDPGVLYFGPGVHRPGLMTLGNDETVYIAGGAIVYGGIRVKDASNIKVTGRGILDDGFQLERMILLESSSHIEFNGIIIRNGGGWTNTVVNSNDVRYQDVKILSFGPAGDGVDPLGSRNVVIDHCFFRCTDDCMAIKSPDSTMTVRNIKITNNTMIGFAFSDGATIGFETNGPEIDSVIVQNCDILMARGGSRVEGHSAFSIICDGPALIHHILFDEIRVEHPVLKLFELNVTDGNLYGVNPPGHIEDITVQNIAWEKPAPIVLKGFDAQHAVKNVTFINCSIGGDWLTSEKDSVFQINQFVYNVKVD
jgi:hypothetical protein